MTNIMLKISEIYNAVQCNTKLQISAVLYNGCPLTSLLGIAPLLSCLLTTTPCITPFPFTPVLLNVLLRSMTGWYEWVPREVLQLVLKVTGNSTDGTCLCLVLLKGQGHVVQ